jgi:hypothetical protein
MILTAIIFFLFAAIFGAVLLTKVLKDHPTPKPVAVIHGAIASIALLMLIVYVINGHTAPLLIASLVIFVIAALGGFTMFIIDISKKPIPKVAAVFHPLLAISGVILLIIYLFQTLA